MVLPSSRTNLPDDEMSSAFVIAEQLERRERARVPSLSVARAILAQRLRIGIGTFENIVRRRVKRVDSTVRDRLHALLIREYESEIMRLNHELEVLRRCGAHFGSHQVSEVETHLAKARALLNGEAG